MIAAGWSDAEVAASVREMIGGWYRLLAEVARREQERGADLGRLHAGRGRGADGRRRSSGAEELILLGVTEDRAAVALGAAQGRAAAASDRRGRCTPGGRC